MPEIDPASPPWLQPLPATYQAVLNEWQLCTEDRDRDTHELCKLAASHLKTQGRQLSISTIGPCLACIWVDLNTRAGFRAAYSRLVFRVFKTALEHVFFRGRPMWNDYLMGCWQVGRQPETVTRLARHLAKAARTKNVPVFESGMWMTASVSRQDPVFRDLWKVEWSRAWTALTGAQGDPPGIG